MIDLLRDRRMWWVIGLGLCARLGWEGWYNRRMDQAIFGQLSSGSLEARPDDELGTLDLLSTEATGTEPHDVADARMLQAIERANLGTQGGVSVGRDGTVRKSSIYAGDRTGLGWATVPAWAIAGGAGLLLAGAGVMISVVLLRARGDDEDPDAA